MTVDTTYAALAKSRPKMIASYSTSLLVIENWRRMARSVVSLSSDYTKTPALLAHWLDEPSVHIIHAIGFSSLSFSVVNSAMKLAKACALIMALGWYWTSNSPGSTTHRTSHPATSELFIVFRSDLSVLTTMVFAWKYGLSFQETVINAKSIFSIGGYLLLAS